MRKSPNLHFSQTAWPTEMKYSLKKKNIQQIINRYNYLISIPNMAAKVHVDILANLQKAFPLKWLGWLGPNFFCTVNSMVKFFVFLLKKISCTIRIALENIGRNRKKKAKWLLFSSKQQILTNRNEIWYAAMKQIKVYKLLNLFKYEILYGRQSSHIG